MTAIAHENQLDGDVETTSAAIDQPRRRRRRIMVPVVATLVLGLLLALAARNHVPGQTVAMDDLPVTTPTVVLPDPLRPVEPTTLDNGYYLTVSSKVLTYEDEALLATAQELAVEARAAGYVNAKIAPRPASKSYCDEHMCVDGVAAIGYLVILEGPYSVPMGTADEYEWRRSLWIDKAQEAASRGLTVEPDIYWYDFLPTE
jgi:hypothetical protein